MKKIPISRTPSSTIAQPNLLTFLSFNLWIFINLQWHYTNTGFIEMTLPEDKTNTCRARLERLKIVLEQQVKWVLLYDRDTWYTWVVQDSMIAKCAITWEKK